MNEIRQHIPGFVEGPEPQTATFETLDELLAIPFVKQWSEDKGFHRLSISRREGATSLLMAEYKLGAEWWVVGYLNADVDLPEWQKPVPAAPR